MSYTAPNSASRYIKEETNLSYASKVGFGRAFEDNQVRAAAANMDIGGHIEQAGTNILMRGFEDSGMLGKAVAGVTAQGAGYMADVGNKAHQTNEDVKSRAQGVIAQVKSNQDNLDLQAEQFNQSQSGDWTDILGGIGMAANIIPGVSGIFNMFKKKGFVENAD